MNQHLLRALVAIAVATPVTSAFAKDQYLEMRFERSRHRAMGGVDIAIDHTTPANGAIGGGTKLTVLGFDLYSTLSEGIRAYRTGRDVWETGFNTDLDSVEGLETLQEQVSAFVNDVNGKSFYLELHNRIDLVQALFNKGPWTVQLGAYSETLGGARAWVPQQIRLVDGGGGDQYIDFGSRTTLVRAGARTDVGGSLGAGITLPLAEKFRLAVGARGRGFYRISLPEHVAVVNAEVRSSADVEFPTKIEQQHGWGIGVDLYSTIQFSEDLTGFRIAAYMEDIFKYVDRGDKTFVSPPRFGLGMAWVSEDSNFTVGADVERIESLDPTFQVGMSYRAGTKAAYFTPKLGFTMNHRDIMGTELSPTITTGLDVTVGPAFFSGAMEYQTATKAFNAGLSLSLGF